MKNITKMLEKNNLTPRENVLTLIRNYAHRKVSGKSILTEADTQALIEGFCPKNIFESREYHKYRKMWEAFTRFEHEMYILSLALQIDLLNFDKATMMFSYEKISTLEKAVGVTNLNTKNHSFLYLLENTWLDYEETMHRHIFLSLPIKAQRRLKELSSHYEWEPGLINQREMKDRPELYTSWVKEEKKQLLKINEMVNTGELKIAYRKDNPFNSKHKTKVITGNSLYYADDSIVFIREYKKQVEQISVYGYLYSSLKEQDFEKKIGIVLSFQKISRKISNIIGTEASSLPIILIMGIRKNVDEINTFLQRIENKIEDIIWTDNDMSFRISTSFSGLGIDLKKVRPQSNEIIDSFNEEVERLLGTEWKN